MLNCRRPWETCACMRHMRSPRWATCSFTAVAATFCAARCMKRIWPSLLLARRLPALPLAVAVGAEAGDAYPSPSTLFMMAVKRNTPPERLLLTCSKSNVCPVCRVTACERLPQRKAWKRFTRASQRLSKPQITESVIAQTQRQYLCYLCRVANPTGYGMADMMVLGNLVATSK